MEVASCSFAQPFSWSSGSHGQGALIAQGDRNQLLGVAQQVSHRVCWGCCSFSDTAQCRACFSNGSVR